MLENWNENESLLFLKEFVKKKNYIGNEEKLASSYNFYAKDQKEKGIKYSIKNFCERFGLRQQTLSEKLRNQKIVLDKFTNSYVKEKNSLKIEKEIKIEKKYSEVGDDLLVKLNNLEKTVIDIDLKLNKLLKTEKSEYNKEEEEEVGVVSFRNYIRFNSKALHRSFEIYDLIFNYFRFMIKNFDGRLMREVINQLIVDYGENLVSGSYKVYSEYMSNGDDWEENLLDLKEKMKEMKGKKNG